MSSEDSSKLVKLSGGRNTSELFRNSFLNLITHSNLVLNELGCEESGSKASNNLSCDVADWDLIELIL